MSGTDDITFSGTNGSVTVQLGFVAAKIELIVKDNRTNLTGGTIEIADETLYCCMQVKRKILWNNC